MKPSIYSKGFKVYLHNRMKKGNILVTLLQPFTPRAVLYTGLLQNIAKNGYIVTVLVPEEKLSFYKSSSYSEGLTFQPVPISEYNQTFIHNLKSFFEYGIHTNIKKFHAKEVYLRDRRWLSHILRHVQMNTIGRSNILQNLLRILFSFALRNTKTGVEKYISKNITMFFSTDIYNEYDLLFIESALRKNVRTIGMVRSWDNNVSKLLLPFIPTQILTQNEIQRNELKTVQGIPLNTATPIGIPYYEYYNQYTPTGRELFMESLGIPSDSKLILFSPAGSKFIDHDWQFCKIIKEAIENKTLPHNTHVIVRCHPGNPCDLSLFTQDEHFTIERPGIIIDKTRGNKGAELDMHATNHLIDEIVHADVVVNILSSIVLDAAIMGTPVVTPQFEGLENEVSFLKSVKRFQTEENMAMLLQIWKGSRPRTQQDFVYELQRVLSGDTATDILALKRIRDNYYNQQSNETATRRLHNILSRTH